MCLWHDQPSIEAGLEEGQAVAGLSGAMCKGSTVAEGEPTGAPAKSRALRLPARIWELPEKLLCPIVGTCLPVAEVHRLARKHGLIDRQASDYDAHVAVIVQCKRRTPLAKEVQRELDRRYVLWVGRFERIRDERAALAAWREALDRGEAAGALWGVVTGRAATEALLQQVYEDIHMFQHQVGAGARADLKRLQALQARVNELEGQLAGLREAAQARQAEREALIRDLQAEVERLQALAEENDRLRGRLAQLESGQVMVDMGRRLLLLEASNADLRSAAARAQTLAGRLRSLQEENVRLMRERDLLAAERDALERCYLADAGPGPDCTSDCDACPERLQGRCVLCVGGLANLQAHYRALAERLGVKLILHDGGREEAMARLPELLSQADAVICPIDCVSHAAYHQVKRYCKQLNKPCVLLRASSLASFAEGLRRLGEGRYDLGAPALQSPTLPVDEMRP